MSEQEPTLPRPLGRLLDDLALGLLLGHILIRLFVSAGDKDPGTNLAIHLLAWPPLCLWALKGLLEKRLSLRITGVEVPILIWSAICVYSIFRAPFKLPAIETAGAFVSMAALVPALINIAGPERRGDLSRLMQAAGFGIAIYALLQPLVFLPMMRESDDGQRILKSNDPEMADMAIRLRSNEPWGTFLQPNSLAGFLVLMIPWLAGALADAIRSRSRFALGAALGATIAAMALTGSKGGWVALLAAAGAGAALLFAHHHPEKRRAILAGGLAIGLVVGAAGWFVTSKHVKSMQFRAAYGEAAIKAGMTSPAFGIGLGNFEDAYPQYKGALQEETRKVHNDYLQVFCELGIAGLLAFLAMLGWGIRAALNPARESSTLRPFSAVSLAMAGSTAAFGTWLFTGEFILAIVVAIPAAMFWFTTRSTPPSEDHYSRIGLAAGFLGLLVHLSVDFDLYEYGVAASLFVALALLTLHAPLPPAFPVKRGVALLGAAAALAAMTPLHLLSTRFRESHALVQEAWTVPYGNTLETLLDDAQRTEPLDPEPGVVLATLCRDRVSRLRLNAPMCTNPIDTFQPVEALWFSGWTWAMGRRPNHAPFHFRCAQDHEFAGRLLEDALSTWRDSPGISAMISAMAKDHFQRAREEYQRSVDLYPTRAQGRAALASALARHGTTAEAAPHARAALMYSAMPTDSAHLRLDDATKAEMERLAK